MARTSLRKQAGLRADRTGLEHELKAVAGGGHVDTERRPRACIMAALLLCSLFAAPQDSSPTGGLDATRVLSPRLWPITLWQCCCSVLCSRLPQDSSPTGVLDAPRNLSPRLWPITPGAGVGDGQHGPVLADNTGTRSDTGHAYHYHKRAMMAWPLPARVGRRAGGHFVGA